MITFKQLYETRDKAIFEAFNSGKRMKVLAIEYGLSTSRIKAICVQQRKLQPVYSGKWPELKG